MAIERTTNTIALSIIEKGTPGWGVITNQNMDLIDQAFSLDRARITSLESETAALPLAIAGKIGHNLLQNNVFSRAVLSDPALPVGWTILTSSDINDSSRTNGAVGYATRDTSTYLVGKGGSQPAASLRLSITNVNISPSMQTRPFPGVQPILDPSNNAPIATNDSRQIANGFEAAIQPVILSANTVYTLSSYGKAEIPTATPPINVHWKIGIVFKSGSSVLHSHFSTPQMNYTSDTGTKSFERAELTFTTPDLPVVQAEVWLVCAGNSPGSIGSCYFDGVQLEQASRATHLETFSMRNGDLAVDGDLIVGGSLKLQQDQLVLATNKVVFSGNVQIGDDITEDILDVFTKISTFYGPVKILGDTIIGDSTSDDDLKITVSKTTFFNNGDSLAPEGGDVEIQGDLVVKGDVVLGDNPAQDTVTINATLTTAVNDISVGGDLDVEGSLTVDRATTLGTNQPTDKLTINYSTLGVDIDGDVRMDDDLTVDHSVEFGTAGTCSVPSSDTFTAHAGVATFDGTMVIGRGLMLGGPSAPCDGGPVYMNTNGGDFDVLANNVTVDAYGVTYWDTSMFTLTGSMSIGQSNVGGQSFHVFAEDIILGDQLLPSQLLVNASNGSTFTGDVTSLGDLTITYGANIKGTPLTGSPLIGDPFTYGTGLLPSRSFVSYQPIISPDSLNVNSTFPGQSLLGGTISFGDGYDTRLVSGRRKYLTNVNFYAGKTSFGGPGIGPGAENTGDVDIGGNLVVYGSTTLGNDIVQDQVHITAYELLINTAGAGDGYGNATIKIGGGFQNVTWTGSEFMQHYLTGNRGGITMDNNGNLWMDGKLTVKGPIDPIEVIITPLTDSSQVNALTISLAGSNKFVVSKTGDVAAKGTLSLDDGYMAYISSTATTFARSGAPLTNFTVWSNEATFSNHITAPSLSSDAIDVEDITVYNNATVQNNLTVQQDLTVLGDSITLGSGMASGSLQAPLDEFVFGIDGASRGNVLVANDLTVRHNVTMGSFDSTANLTFDAINIAVDSQRQINVDPHGPNTIELKGLRIGGGYQNTVFNGAQLDHGGVTIDAYGNIFADGRIFANGDFSFNALTLTSHLGTPLCDFLLRLENKTLNDFVFWLDNLGNVEADGYYIIHDKNIGDTCNQPVSQTYPNTAATMFKIVNDTLVDTVFEVDNVGNVIADGYLTTLIPGGSNLAAASVTVGTGTLSLGDFNLAGHQNASVNPIQAALDFVASRGGGTVYVKQGTYPLPVGGLTMSSGTILRGDGISTILDGSTNITTTGIVMGDECSLSSLFITDCGTGVQLLGENCSVTNVTLDQCSVSFDVDGASALVQGNHATVLNSVSLTKAITIDGDHARVTNNVFEASQFSNSIGINIRADFALVEGNRVSNFLTKSIQEESSESTIIRNNTISHAAGSNMAIELSGNNALVDGNMVTGTLVGVAILTGSRHKVTNNTLVGIPMSTAAVQSSATDVLVSGNICRSFEGSVLQLNGDRHQVSMNNIQGGTDAISLASSSSIISNNDARGYTGTGIVITGNACSLQGNRTVGGGTALTGISITGNEHSIVGNYVVDHTVNGIVVVGDDAIAAGNVTLRNP